MPAYEALGQHDDAKAAMEKALSLRPGSNLGNMVLPTKNESAAFLDAVVWLKRAFVVAGLPEK